MRVLLAATSTLPDRMGGSERVIWHLARGLSARGHETRIVVPRTVRNLPRASRIDGIAIARYEDRFHSFATLYLSSLWSAQAAIREILRGWRPDAIHAHHGVSGLASSWAGGRPLHYMVERAIAAHLPEGSLASLTYAFRLLNFPLNAATLLFRPLARHAARDDTAPVEALLNRALRLTVIFMVPLAAVAIALAEPAVRVLLERGAFTSRSTSLTGSALATTHPALSAWPQCRSSPAPTRLCTRSGGSSSPGFAVIALNIVLMPTLTAWLGFRGLPVAMSLNWTVLLVVMVLAIRPRLPGLALSAIAVSTVLSAGAGVVAALGASLVFTAVGHPGLIGLMAATTAGLGAYALLLFWLAPEDARLAAAFLSPYWRPSGRPPSMDAETK